ncbi:hypothetical protein ACP4OV_005465 [Aristida adscensionis]
MNNVCKYRDVGAFLQKGGGWLGGLGPRAVDRGASATCVHGGPRPREGVCPPGPGAMLGTPASSPPAPQAAIFVAVWGDPSFYYPYVAAADPSGAILLCAGHRSDWNGPDEPNRARFFLCDAASGKATQLPDHLFARHAGRMELIRDDGGRVMVAYLNHAPASASRQASTSLLCHWAGSEGWTTKPLACPVDVAARDWGKDGVVALGGRLWWVDLACGLLTCDPFADAPDLAYIPLPPGCGLPDAGPGVRRELDKRRFVKASRGRLRFVDIHLADDGGGDLTVTMWTARDGGWVPRYSVAFPDIWAHPSFTTSRGAAEPERYDMPFEAHPSFRKRRAAAEPLLREVPVLALVHPFNPDVL